MSGHSDHLVAESRIAALRKALEKITGTEQADKCTDISWKRMTPMKPQDKLPDDEKEPPVTVEEWERSVADYDGFNDDLDTLISLADTAQSIASQISGLEKTKKELKKLIEPLAKKMSVPRRLLGDTWELRQVSGSRSTIVREELIARGVPVQVIVDSTDTESWDGYAVYAVKKKKGEGL